VKSWFDDQKIPYQSINILKHEITPDELKDMLNKSLDGTDDIISTRSKVFQERHINIDDMSVGELCQFIKENPTILKRPIIVDDKQIQVGYNSDDIEIFEKAKSLASSCCKKGVCPNFDDCEHHFSDKREHCEDNCEK